MFYVNSRRRIYWFGQSSGRKRKISIKKILEIVPSSKLNMEKKCWSLHKMVA